MISDPSIVERVLDWSWAVVCLALGWIWRIDRRVQAIEVDTLAVKKSVDKSAQNGERLARVETSLESVTDTMSRLEGKIDRVLER